MYRAKTLQGQCSRGSGKEWHRTHRRNVLGDTNTLNTLQPVTVWPVSTTSIGLLSDFVDMHLVFPEPIRVGCPRGTWWTSGPSAGCRTAGNRRPRH